VQVVVGVDLAFGGDVARLGVGTGVDPAPSGRGAVGLHLPEGGQQLAGGHFVAVDLPQHQQRVGVFIDAGAVVPVQVLDGFVLGLGGVRVEALQPQGQRVR